MKKKLLVCLLLAVFLLSTWSLAASAEAQIPSVNDYADILTAEERAELREKADAIFRETGFPVYIVIVEDYGDYVSGSIGDFTEQIFERYTLGSGSSGDGLLLALSMDERDYDIYAHGDFGNAAFTDYGKSLIAGEFLSYFQRDDWAGGLESFLSQSYDYILKARSGEPVDIWIPDEAEVRRGFDPVEILLIIGIPGVIALAVVKAMIKSMKTAVKQTEAEDYLTHNGLSLSRREDTFLNRSVTRAKVPRSDSSGRSGGHYGGTSVGSSGGSHSSGKF